MDADDRLLRLESAVIYLQEIVPHADILPKDKQDKAAIKALGELTAQISAEHQLGSQ